MKAESRLDPVRWRRPGRAALLRSTAVAALLVMAAMIGWSDAPGCDPAHPASTAQDDRLREAAAGRSHDGSSAGPAGAGSHVGQTRDGSPADPDATRSSPPLGDGGNGGPPPSPGAGPDAGGRSAVPAGRVGVPIRLAEPAALSLVHPGDRVDLLHIEEAGGTTPVAGAALVLGKTGADDPVTGGILVALRPPEAAKALSSSGRGFAVLVRPG